MREQSAWLLPATPRARREGGDGGRRAQGPRCCCRRRRRASERGPCSRAPERSPQPRPHRCSRRRQRRGRCSSSNSPRAAQPLKGASRGPGAPNSLSPHKARAGALGAWLRRAIPRTPRKGLRFRATCRRRRCIPPAGGPGPGAASTPLPLGGWTDYCSLHQQPADWETQPSLGTF